MPVSKTGVPGANPGGPAMGNTYHGIILDAEFKHPDYVNRFSIFAKRTDVKNDWICFGIEIEAEKLEQTINDIQKNLRADAPFYAHLYNGKELIVIFREKVFRVGLDKKTWRPLKEYGSRVLQIPCEQLDFWPTTFEEEPKYFTRERGLIG